eukprot:EC798466.1.p3 GENE.EC798466.1~~EC798466.1.p3  ORF type:complete len:71 (+),score=3.59 EC798466.1:353-565(+)
MSDCCCAHIASRARAAHHARVCVCAHARATLSLSVTHMCERILIKLLTLLYLPSPYTLSWCMCRHSTARV